ncbi:undecaprenyl-diphosphate phosphatase [Kribbella sp. NPDC055110]
MNWFQVAVLAVVQGLTEFLPVSSSAHLRVVSALMDWPDPGVPRSPPSPNWGPKPPY